MNLIVILPKLFLPRQEVAIKTQAAGILMYTLITTEAKLRVVNLPTAQLLLENAQKAHQHPTLQVNATVALTSIAESAAGRAYLKSQLPILNEIIPANCQARRHSDKLIATVIREV